MPNNTPFLDLIILKLLAFLPKIMIAVVGAVFGLMLSGDIGRDGKIKISLAVIIKFTIAVTISLVGGSAHIEIMGWQNYSIMVHGLIMLMWAVFGMLAIGIIYQSLALLQGKPIAEIIKEVKDAAFAIFGK
ncbi:hypothetical protein [Psychrobacter sp. MES7-P7E]|uniref:hypothetical protein n=1 Tax=Psychrobacter sp. MES7-P7E TaxID=2058322 RepID=UPI000C7EDF30|nr:hypothetical protein [Psychrobacter sp. MES7-P7E]PLT21271.1 hypothetical protein CXF62_10880 [Psychrobacter sp. MES7-P7E]